MRNNTLRWGGGIAAIIVATVIFLVPFAFILFTAAKTPLEASLLQFSWPTEWQIWQNIVTVIETRDFLLVRAFFNSVVLTVVSVGLITVLSAMVGFVLQRRRSKWNPVINGLVLAGLIIPPAVVPTIWVLQALGLFKTMPGLIFIHLAFGLPFGILLFRAFMNTVPRELDEAAIIDGASPLRLFFSVILPLLRPVMLTIIVVQSVFVFNDFTYALYFLPGDENATVQLSLYNFSAQNLSQWNLLFANILLITLPPLVMYIFFNRQIVSGMTSGAVKG
ncbi:carbohydrate ABC transporter permease [Microbacterium hominis]|uniref:Carbohydrate ABC transporter permease n=1 Tax=Microbacterium hominis TaxID=162426 RepID=A0A7D4QKJ9_9MICO|nr:carbohydrate ABC transporter permease [Microbacterium hominis]QKJ20516.1 carbohydrate ABC transporter permease [Microbacterium hominis]